MERMSKADNQEERQWVKGKDLGQSCGMWEAAPESSNQVCLVQGTSTAWKVLDAKATLEATLQMARANIAVRF